MVTNRDFSFFAFPVFLCQLLPAAFSNMLLRPQLYFYLFHTFNKPTEYRLHWKWKSEKEKKGKAHLRLTHNINAEYVCSSQAIYCYENHIFDRMHLHQDCLIVLKTKFPKRFEIAIKAKQRCLMFLIAMPSVLLSVHVLTSVLNIIASHYQFLISNILIKQLCLAFEYILTFNENGTRGMSIAKMTKLHELDFELLSHSICLPCFVFTECYLFENIRSILQGKRVGKHKSET